MKDKDDYGKDYLIGAKLTATLGGEESPLASYQIGQYFLDKGIISQSELETALMIQKTSKKRLGRILIELGAITYNQLIEFLSAYNPDALVEERAVLTSIETNILNKYKTVVLSETPDTLFIATVDPDVVPILEKALKKKVILKPVDLSNFLDQLKQIKTRVSQANITNPNVLLDTLIRLTMNKQGSDIHIETIGNICVIRIRVDGVLHILDVLRREIGDMLIARVKGLSGMDIAEKKYPQDGGFKYTVSESKTIDIRSSNMPTVTGEAIVLRVLDKDRVMANLDEVGIRRIEKWKEAIKNHDGIILVTGPTGAGKTTTLYATLLELDRLGRNIITIEDPVEYQFPFIRQVQVNRVLNLDFATFLKHALRQDPDVILVGEIRDPETARTAIRAAETGHLVFATLHSNDIQSTFVRLADLGVPLTDLKYTLRAVMSQILVRRVCKSCNGKGTLPSGRKCIACDGTGYRGRKPVSEILVVTPDIVDRVIKGKPLPAYETMYEDAMLLIREGITTCEEVERAFGECDRNLLESMQA